LAGVAIAAHSSSMRRHLRRMCFREFDTSHPAQKRRHGRRKADVRYGKTRCDRSTRTHMARRWTGGRVGTLMQIEIYRGPHFP
jgi:hypothetical protein